MEITGKTLNDIGEIMYPVPGDFMLLGGVGSATRYATKKAALSAISAEIAETLYKKIPDDVSDRIDRLSAALDTGGDVYLRKNPSDQSVAQEVKSPVAVYGALDVLGDVNLRQKADGKLLMPVQSYIGGSGPHDMAATRGYVDDSVYGLSVQIQPVQDQILDVDYDGYASLTAVCKRPYIYNSQYGLDGVSAGNFYKYDGLRRDCSVYSEDDDKAGTVYVVATGYVGVPLTRPYTDYKTLTFVAVAATNAASEGTGAFVAKNLNLTTVQVADIEIARMYKEYLSRYRNLSDKSRFLENANFQWCLGETILDPYFSIKADAKFDKSEPYDRMFVPFYPGSNGYAVVAVFGRS